MPKKTMSYIIALLVIFFSSLAWYSVGRSIGVEGIGDFVFPAVAISMYAISLGLLTVFVRESLFSFIIVMLSFVGSLALTGNPFHLIAVAVGIAFIWMARNFIKEDLENSIKISVSKSLSVGFYEIVIGISLVISSQYFFSVQGLGGSELVPKIESNKMTSEIVSFALGKFNPEFGKIKDENLTLNEFLGEAYETMLRQQQEQTIKKIEEKKKELESLSSENSRIEIVPGELPDGTKESVINSWKEEISRNVGYQVQGDEKTVDVMIALINSKTAKAAGAVNAEGNDVNKVALIFAVILMLTLIPLGSFLSRLWIFFCWLAFVAFRKIGIVKVEKSVSEIEKIA